MPAEIDKAKDILDRYDFHASKSIYLKPSFPEKKIKNALAEYAKDIKLEDVLVFVDDTVFGSGKDGLIFSRAGLHLHEAFSKPVFIATGDIRDIRAEKKKLSVNDTIKVTLGTLTPENIENLAHLLLELATGKGAGVPAMEFIDIEPGTFIMGTEAHYNNHIFVRGVNWLRKKESEELLDIADDQPHQVTISKPFALGKYPVTQEQWTAVMGSNPCENQFKGNDKPFGLTDPDKLILAVDAFLARLNAAQNEYIYRLPTEAEWEYACRAGTKTPWFFEDEKEVMLNLEADFAPVDGSPALARMLAWQDDFVKYVVGSNSAAKPETVAPAGFKRPNPWGLYDMCGNVWELVQDFYAPYQKGPAVDPCCTQGQERVFRGGSFSAGILYCRSTYRRRAGEQTRGKSYMGFRLVRVSRLEAGKQTEPAATAAGIPSARKVATAAQTPVSAQSARSEQEPAAAKTPLDAAKTSITLHKAALRGERIAGEYLCKLYGVSIDAYDAFAETFSDYLKNIEEGTNEHTALGFICAVGYDKSTISHFEKIAVQGDVIAQMSLAVAYEQGLGKIGKDMKKAFSWYKMAAERGEHHAQFNLGLAYLVGEGAQHDPRLAMAWFLESVKQENKYAASFVQSLIFNYNRHNKSTPPDDELINVAQWFYKSGNKYMADVMRTANDMREKGFA